MKETTHKEALHYSVFVSFPDPEPIFLSQKPSSEFIIDNKHAVSFREENCNGNSHHDNNEIAELCGYKSHVTSGLCMLFKDLQCF